MRKDFIDIHGDDFSNMNPFPYNDLGHMLSSRVIKEMRKKGIYLELECSNGIVKSYKISNGKSFFLFELQKEKYMPIDAGCDSMTNYKEEEIEVEPSNRPNSFPSCM